MSKFEELHKLKDKMEKDNALPLKAGATKLVFGTGNTEAKILCIGEGPGYNEDQQGLPFVGQAGKLLDKLLLLAGLERKQVFITNVVHHRPPENRDPEPDEIEAYGKYLDEIITIMKPEVIITLGRFSMGKFLPNVFISQVHGQKFDVQFNSHQLTVIPMYHPAASLRNGAVLEKEHADFVNLKKILKEIKDNNQTKEIKNDKQSLAISKRNGKMDSEQTKLV